MTGRLRVLEAGAALIVGFLVIAPLVALVWPADADAPVDGGGSKACAGAAEEPLEKKPAWAGRGKDWDDEDKDDPDDKDDADDEDDKDEAREQDDGKGKDKPAPKPDVANVLPPAPAASGSSVQC